MDIGHLINTVSTKMPSNMLRYEEAVDLQRIICSHQNWVGTQPETSRSLNHILKEQDNLLLEKYNI